jgi:hypothetical protein
VINYLSVEVSNMELSPYYVEDILSLKVVSLAIVRNRNSEMGTPTPYWAQWHIEGI